MRPGVFYKILCFTVLALDVFFTINPLDIYILSRTKAAIGHRCTASEQLFLAVEALHSNLHMFSSTVNKFKSITRPDPAEARAVGSEL
jgi:hypothetical protein